MSPSPYRDEAVLNNGSSYYGGMASVQEKKRFTAYGVVKRTMDIVGSLAGILLLSPLIMLIALCIKLEDPKGPIFFFQTRIGKNGKMFRMYKLRSMAVNAEEKLQELMDKNEISGAMFKMKDDPRITKVGKIIRKRPIGMSPVQITILIHRFRFKPKAKFQSKFLDLIRQSI